MNEEDKCSFFNKLINGNHKAHRELYRLYAMEIYKYIKSYFQFDSFSADDILQEVFITAYMKISSLKDINKIRVWLYKIAGSKCLNFIKKKKVERKYMEEYGENINSINNKSPEDRVIEKEVFKMVNNEVLRLPGLLREVFILREYQNLKYDEIASITDTSLSRVKKAMKKAFSKLTKYLEKKNINKDVLLK